MRRTAPLQPLALETGLRRRGMQARLRTRPRIDALEPCVDVLQRRVDRLLDAPAKVQRAIQNDIGDREAIARNILLAPRTTFDHARSVLPDRHTPLRRTT